LSNPTDASKHASWSRVIAGSESVRAAPAERLVTGFRYLRQPIAVYVAYLFTGKAAAVERLQHQGAEMVADSDASLGVPQRDGGTPFHGAWVRIRSGQVSVQDHEPVAFVRNPVVPSNDSEKTIAGDREHKKCGFGILRTPRYPLLSPINGSLITMVLRGSP
jgi:hypothetical protein